MLSQWNIAQHKVDNIFAANLMSIIISTLGCQKYWAGKVFAKQKSFCIYQSWWVKVTLYKFLKQFEIIPDFYQKY